RAERSGPDAGGVSAEGVDANAGKQHLLDVARRLDIRGRSTMRKAELVTAIKKHNRRARRR
ncbi:Rho termination factor N-terminal domain-containing protein, partial [Mycolicibacter minnesotensis]